MRPLKILWLARNVPLPLESGDKLYTAHLARSLAEAGAQVTFMAMAPEHGRDTNPHAFSADIAWDIISGAPRSKMAAVFSRYPLVGARYATRDAKNALHLKLAGSAWDAIILDQYAMGWALDHLNASRSCRPLVVYVAHDFETEVTAQIARNYRGNPATKLFLHFNARKTAAMEARLAREVDLITVISEEDGVAFARLGTRRQPIVFTPGYSGARLAARSVGAGRDRRVIILGSFDWIAKQMNLNAFLQAADDIFAARGVAVDVIGKISPELRTQWAGRLKATRFLGFVEDVQAQLEQARMGLVIEATGGGFKLKTLDYIFARLPVAALEVALGGIGSDLRRCFIVADNAAALATAVCDSIDDIAQLNARQDCAFRAAENAFNWSTRGESFLSALEECCGRRGRANKGPMGT